MKQYHIIADRPVDIPQNWEIHNAPRPITGTRLWTGDFIHGVFFAAIDPNDEFAATNTQTNQALDAWKLTYYTEAQAREELKHMRPQSSDRIDALDALHIIQTFTHLKNRQKS